jgi:hypothetical protein
MAKVGLNKEQLALVKPAPDEDRLFNPKELPTITPEEKKRGEALYKERLSYFQGTEKEALRCILKVYWERGEFVSKLLQGPGNFGNNTAGKFAKDMGCSVEQVRSWYRFHTTYSSMTDVDRLTNSGIPWRKVCILTTVHDAKKRQALEEKANEISSEDLQEEVKSFSTKEKVKAKKEGRKPANRGGCKPRASFSNLAGFCEGPFSKRLANALAALEEMKSLDPEFFERSKETKIKAETALSDLLPKINQFLAEAKLVN